MDGRKIDAYVYNYTKISYVRFLREKLILRFLKDKCGQNLVFSSYLREKIFCRLPSAAGIVLYMYERQFISEHHLCGRLFTFH